MMFTQSSTSITKNINDANNILPEGYVPQPQDILCGKTKESFNHVGNRRFRVTISMFLQRYNELRSRSERGALIASVVDTILTNGGHFLKQRNNRWVTLTPKQARSKVGHALRDASWQQQKGPTIRPRSDVEDDVSDESVVQRNKRQRTMDVTPAEPLSADFEPILIGGDGFEDSARWSVTQLEFLLDDFSSDSESSDDDEFIGYINQIDFATESL